MDHPDFISGGFSTKWLEGVMDDLKASSLAAEAAG
jgi:hypothetical protein